MTAMISDMYPSRTGESATMTVRQDPVLWSRQAGTAEPEGPLSADKLDQFDQQGFLFLPAVFSTNEVHELLLELARLGEQPDLRASPECIIEPRSQAVRSIFNVHRRSQVFARLVADARLSAAAAQILGSPLYVHQSRVNFKPGFHGEEFYWHSDFETWHVEDGMPRMRAISFSLLLTANNQFNGPLMVVPGSHRQFVACVGRTPAEHFRQSLRKQEYGVPDDESLTTLITTGGIEAPCGPAGSLLIFDCNLMHGSAGNLSPWPRSNVFIVFNHVDNRLVDPFCGLPPRPDYIATRNEGAL